MRVTIPSSNTSVFINHEDTIKVEVLEEEHDDCIEDEVEEDKKSEDILVYYSIEVENSTGISTSIYETKKNEEALAVYYLLLKLIDSDIKDHIVINITNETVGALTFEDWYNIEYSTPIKEEDKK